MTDASHNRSLSPDRQPGRDEARLELRASDADRDRTAAVLGGALGAGRLTTTEYAERLDTTYAAKTSANSPRLPATSPPTTPRIPAWEWWTAPK